MKRILFLLAFISSFVYGQNISPYKAGPAVGLNSAKFFSDTVDYKASTLPLGGLSATFKLTDKFDLQLQGLYSFKGSVSLSPGYNLRNSYLDFRLTPHYKISDNFQLIAGVQYASLLSSQKITLSGEKQNGKQGTELLGFKSQVDYPVGIQLGLQKSIDLGITYNLPIGDRQYRNLKLSLIIDVKSITFENKKERKRKLAKDQINHMKDGVLLVRLKTSEKVITALKEKGYQIKAKEVQLKQEKANQVMIESFDKHFDFCPVYYFYSYDTKSIKTREFDSVSFVGNDTINKHISTFSGNKIFIAEFGLAENDTTKLIADEVIISTDNFSLEKVPVYYQSEYFNISGLLIKSDQFIQLTPPFPFLYKSGNITKNYSTIPRVVKGMNSSLWNYHQMTGRLKDED